MFSILIYIMESKNIIEKTTDKTNNFFKKHPTLKKATEKIATTSLVVPVPGAIPFGLGLMYISNKDQLKDKIKKVRNKFGGE